jgi:hypothetical protein
MSHQVVFFNLHPRENHLWATRGETAAYTTWIGASERDAEMGANQERASVGCWIAYWRYGLAASLDEFILLIYARGAC